jgi:hypothetical protein
MNEEVSPVVAENEQLKKDNEELNAKLIELNNNLNAMQETANMLLRACRTARVADKMISIIALEEAIAQATNTKSPLAIIPREEYENLLKEKK